MDDAFNNNQGVVPPAFSLSPRFAREDDVAHYLHNGLGSRGGGCGRYILKSPEGYYVAMEPAVDAAQLNHRALLAKGAGEIPSGYMLQGFYFVDPTPITRTGLTPTESTVAQNAFALGDLYRFVQRRGELQGAYRSNPDGSLLWFGPSGSDLENMPFLPVDSSDAARQTVDQQLQALDDLSASTSSSFVRHFAKSSALWVVVGSEVWGPPGRVEDSWQPLPRPVSAPISVQPLLSQVFATSQAVLGFIRTTLDMSKGSRQLGFILKNKLKNEYVATFPRIDSFPFLSVGSVFPRNPNGRLMLPSGFELYGPYFFHAQSPDDLGEIEPWLQQDFFSIPDLLTAIVRGRSIGAEDQPGASVIHLMSADGAVLSYQSRQTQAEQAMLGMRDAGALREEDGLVADLKSGALTPRALIRKVAAAGTLNVVVAGTTWDITGLVTEHWKPFATFPSQPFNARFVRLDDAARYVREQILAQPEQAVREFGSFILKDAQGHYLAGSPIQGNVASFKLRTLLPTAPDGQFVPPEGTVLVASFHSHRPPSRERSQHDRERFNAQNLSAEERAQALAEDAFRRCMFSVADIASLLGNPNVPAVSYLLSADGSLVRCTTAQTAAEVELLKRVSGPKGYTDHANSEIQGNLSKGTLMASEFARWVARATDLHVVVPGPLWGPAGTITASWLVSASPKKPNGSRLMTFGPIFPSLDDALNWLHKRAQRDSGQRRFANVLKHAERNEFVASHPLALGALDPLPEAFGSPGVGRIEGPYPYDIVGLYCIGPVLPVAQPPHDAAVFRQFVEPLYLNQVCKAAFASRPEKSNVSVPVYIGARDGALLKYQPGPEVDFLQAQTALMSGAITTSDFIRTLGGSAKLEVLRTSELWGAAEAVGPHWRACAGVERRAWTPLYASPDDAARHANAWMNRQPSDRARGGVVVRRVDGLYLATAPLAGGALVFDVGSVLLPEAGEVLAPGDEVVAFYYKSSTRKGPVEEGDLERLERNVFAPHELALSLNASSTAKSCYFSTSDGSLLRYKRHTTPLLRARCSPRTGNAEALLDNDLAADLREHVLSPLEYFKHVATETGLQVIEGGSFWQELGVLQAHQTAQGPKCSPLFGQRYDALRFLKASRFPSSDLHSCLLLKDTQRDEFMFTELRPQGIEAFAWVGNDPAVSDYAHYSVEAVCLFPPSEAPAFPLGDPQVLETLNRDFLSPVYLDLAQALYPGKTLYLFTVGGAVLQYRSNEPAAVFSDDFAQTVFDYFYGKSTIDLPALVSRVAAAGTLDVLFAGSGWSTEGRVTAVGEPPLQTTGDKAPRQAFSPIFGYAADAVQFAHKWAAHTGKAPGGVVLSSRAAERRFTASSEVSGERMAHSVEAPSPQP